MVETVKESIEVENGLFDHVVVGSSKELVEEDNGLGDDQLFASYSNQHGFSEVTYVGKRVTESHDVPKSKQVVKSNMGLRDLHLMLVGKMMLNVTRLS